MKGYRLGTIIIRNSEQKVNFNGSITESEFNELRKHISNLFEHKIHQELFAIFIINFLDFNEYFKAEIKKLIKNHGNLLENNLVDMQIIYRNANRLFLNYLSSGRTLLDHTETYLKRKYGKSSKEILKFKYKTNKVYDESFEYRFMYKLRNYAQHCGLPINEIIYSINNNREKNERKLNLNPMFNVDKLLDNYDGWGEKLKDDFKSKPKNIPTTSVIGEHFKSFKSLNNTFFKIEIESLNESISFIENFKEKYEPYSQDENIQLCVFYNFRLTIPNSYENSKFDTYNLPIELINEIKTKTTANNL